jgi:hypothetical protein
LREITILKKLELLFYNKNVFHIPYIYDWFIVSGFEKPILSNEFQAKRNKVSTTLKILNDMLSNIHDTAQKNYIEPYMRENIYKMIEEIVKYNDAYIYLENVYLVVIEEYQRKTLANIQNMLQLQIHKDFFSKNKISRYLFEMVYIGYNLGAYGIINGDLHLNNCCVAYNNINKTIEDIAVILVDKFNIAYKFDPNNRRSWVLFPFDTTYISFIDFSRGIMNDKHIKDLCENESSDVIKYYQDIERRKVVNYYRLILNEFYSNNKELIDEAITSHFDDLFQYFGFLDTYSVLSKFYDYVVSLKIDIDKSILTMMKDIKNYVYKVITVDFINAVKYERYKDKIDMLPFVNDFYKDFILDDKIESIAVVYEGQKLYPVSDVFSAKSTLSSEDKIRNELEVLQLRQFKTDSNADDEGHYSIIYNFFCTKELFFKDYRYRDKKEFLTKLVKSEIKHLNLTDMHIKKFRPEAVGGM